MTAKGSVELLGQIYRALSDSEVKLSVCVCRVSFTNLQGQCTCSQLVIQNKKGMLKLLKDFFADGQQINKVQHLF